MFKKEWKSVSAYALAQAIFEAVEGNCSLLEESYKSEDSVWQKISTRALASHANAKDRFWVHISWIKNSHNVQVSISSLFYNSHILVNQFIFIYYKISR